MIDPTSYPADRLRAADRNAAPRHLSADGDDWINGMRTADKRIARAEARDGLFTVLIVIAAAFMVTAMAVS